MNKVSTNYLSTKNTQCHQMRLFNPDHPHDARAAPVPAIAARTDGAHGSGESILLKWRKEKECVPTILSFTLGPARIPRRWLSSYLICMPPTFIPQSSRWMVTSRRFKRFKQGTAIQSCGKQPGANEARSVMPSAVRRVSLVESAAGSRPQHAMGGSQKSTVACSF